MGKNITMKDVAMQLGVSTVTVSKALSDREGVSEALKQMIKNKAEEMGYRYNSMGKSMKEGINYNVGVIVAEKFMDENTFYSKMFQAIAKDLMAYDYFGILEIIPEMDEIEGKMPHIIINNKVDGIIFLGQMAQSYIEKIVSIGIPYVFLDFSDDYFDADTIVSDNFYGSYELTNYLISVGHKKIGFVGNKNATSSIMDRYIGYYKAMLQNKLECLEEWIIDDRDEHGKYIEYKLPIQMPTAFVCNCDEIAYRLILLLKKQGYQVPEDISVVGYDNYIYATISNPALTTVEVNVEAMSEAAVDTMMKRVKDTTKECGRKVISGRIIHRDSVVMLKDDSSKSAQ